MVWISAFVLIGVLIRMAQRKYLKSLPFTVILFFIGFLFGVWAHAEDNGSQSEFFKGIEHSE